MNKWSKEEIEILKGSYDKLRIEELKKFLPNKQNTHAIHVKASSLNLKRTNDRWWTKEQNTYLINNYSVLSKEELIDFIKKSWDAIKIQAEKLELRRGNDLSYGSLRKGNLKILLEETPETYYWLGFLMADGHFTKNRIVCSLSTKDTNHLKKLSKYLKCKIRFNKNKTKVTLSVADKDAVMELRKKFSISNRKTYEPCKITSIQNSKLLISLIAGFIDGDGCIKQQSNRKDFCLTIKCHKSWLNNLEYFRATLEKVFNHKTNPAKLVYKGRYCLLNVGTIKLLQKLKQFVTDLNLPVLERKWKIIDLAYVHKKDKIGEAKKKFLEYNNALSVKDMIEKLKVSQSTIYNFKREIK